MSYSKALEFSKFLTLKENKPSIKIFHNKRRGWINKTTNLLTQFIQMITSQNNSNNIFFASSLCSARNKTKKLIGSLILIAGWEGIDILLIEIFLENILHITIISLNLYSINFIINLLLLHRHHHPLHVKLNFNSS